MKKSIAEIDSASPQVFPCDPGEHFEFSQLLSRCLGNHSLANRLIQNFLKHIGTLSTQLEEAVVDFDLSKTKALAHRLRGEAANLGAIQVCRTAARLELTAGDGNHTEVIQDIASLKSSIADFILHVTRFHPPSPQAVSGPQGHLDREYQV